MDKPLKPPKVLCTCSKCRHVTTFVGVEEHSGRFLRPKTVEQHKEKDLLAQRIREEQAEAELSGSILLAAASATPSTRPVKALPVRRRDRMYEGNGTASTSVRSTSASAPRLHGSYHYLTKNTGPGTFCFFARASCRVRPCHYLRYMQYSRLQGASPMIFYGTDILLG